LKRHWEIEGDTLNEKFRARPIYLLPIFATLVVGLALTYFSQTLQTETYPVTPFPEGLAGSLGNGIYFVVLAAVGAFILYLLLKRKQLKVIVLITGFALTAATFLLSVVYLWPLLSILDAASAPFLVLALAIVVTVIFDFVIFRRKGASHGIAVLLLGGALGAFLSMSIDPLSAVLILILLAIYDVYAVFRGPVGKIAEGGLEKLRGLSLPFKDVQIGLGDLTFYSMLVSLVLANAGPIFCVFSALGVLAGSFIAFKMLERKGIFPGLPFPVILGLAPFLISLVLPLH
jgi:presenilin-like A22 family membrane protease